MGAGSSLTAGFVIGGSTSKTVLVRASGPALAAYGGTGLMPDPQLQLFNGGTQIAANAGWGGNSQIAAEASSVGAFAFVSPTSRDSAAVVTLAPGTPYTVQANSASGGGGLVLVEIYEVP